MCRRTVIAEVKVCLNRSEHFADVMSAKTGKMNISPCDIKRYYLILTHRYRRSDRYKNTNIAPAYLYNDGGIPTELIITFSPENKLEEFEKYIKEKSGEMHFVSSVGGLEKLGREKIERNSVCFESLVKMLDLQSNCIRIQDRTIARSWRQPRPFYIYHDVFSKDKKEKALDFRSYPSQYPEEEDHSYPFVLRVEEKKMQTFLTSEAEDFPEETKNIDDFDPESFQNRVIDTFFKNSMDIETISEVINLMNLSLFAYKNEEETATEVKKKCEVYRKQIKYLIALINKLDSP